MILIKNLIQGSCKEDHHAIQKPDWLNPHQSKIYDWIIDTTRKYSSFDFRLCLPDDKFVYGSIDKYDKTINLTYSKPGNYYSRLIFLGNQILDVNKTYALGNDQFIEFCDFAQLENQDS